MGDNWVSADFLYTTAGGGEGGTAIIKYQNDYVQKRFLAYKRCFNR